MQNVCSSYKSIIQILWNFWGQIVLFLQGAQRLIILQDFVYSHKDLYSCVSEKTRENFLCARTFSFYVPHRTLEYMKNIACIYSYWDRVIYNFYKEAEFYKKWLQRLSEKRSYKPKIQFQYHPLCVMLLLRQMRLKILSSKYLKSFTAAEIRLTKPFLTVLSDIFRKWSDSLRNLKWQKQENSGGISRSKRWRFQEK